MSEGLGLVISDDHVDTVNSFAKLPVSYCASTEDVPDFESPIEAWDQNSSNSCAGHSGAACFTHRQWVETGEMIRFSPWYSYITSQKRGGYYGRDEGTSISSVISSATQDGCCREQLCQRPQSYDGRLSQQAVTEAAAHRHIGTPVDLRDFDELMSWLRDFRCAVVGTRWNSWQSSVKEVETLRLAKGGSFLGYHARAFVGHRKGLPVVLNSHGKGWGINGKATVEREVFEWWRGDANFVCLGFTDINEIVPKRRNLADFSFILPEMSSIG